MGKIKKMAFAASFIVFGIIILIVGITFALGDNIDAIGVFESKIIMNKIIQNSIANSLDDVKQKDFFIIKENDNKEIEAVSFDTLKVNSLVFNVTKELQNEFSGLKSYKESIPIGSIMGNRFISQLNMNISINILPVALTKCDYETSFQSEGINQTKYEIYLNIKSDVRILRPFSNKEYNITNRVLVAQIILLGDVPKSYVNVPKEDILDAT